MPTRLLAAALGGVGLGLAFEPVHLVWVLPGALALFFGAVHEVRPRHGALIGLVFGLTSFGTLLVWMRVLGWDAWFGFALAMTLYLVGLGAVLSRLSGLRCWPVAYAVAWLGVEWFRGEWPFGGVTWGRLGFAAIDTPVEGWLPWIGSAGVSLLLALSGTALAWLFIDATPRRAAYVALGALAVVVLPLLLPTPYGEGETATVALVQGGVPGNGDDLVSHHREVTRNHVAETIALAEEVAAGTTRRPDLVVWPENSTAVDPFDDRLTRERIAEAAEAIGVPVLVGAIVDAPEEGRVLNQGVAFTTAGPQEQRYTKHHPVPFGEFIPFRDQLAGFSSERLGLIPRDMVAGEGSDPLSVAGIELADAICFDVAYDDVLPAQVRNGAELGVVQTSNALFIHTGQIQQQWAISRVRALETGRTVVVASVNGRSGVIGPDGEVVKALPVLGTETAVVDVRLGTGRPPGVWVGPALGPLAAALSMALLVLRRVRYRGLLRGGEDA